MRKRSGLNWEQSGDGSFLTAFTDTKVCYGHGYGSILLYIF